MEEKGQNYLNGGDSLRPTGLDVPWLSLSVFPPSPQPIVLDTLEDSSRHCIPWALALTWPSSALTLSVLLLRSLTVPILPALFIYLSFFLTRVSHARAFRMS